MTRFWIGLVLFAIGCSRTPTPPSSITSDSRSTESASGTTPTTSQYAPPTLTVGSPAPPLKVSRFLKGEPVAAFEPGKIYVVEFWATWCGPCIQAMPHVSELQKRYPKVTFIGVNVWEDSDTAADDFLKERGRQLIHRIARDDIPEGGNAYDGAMAKTWLAAAEVNGIPTAMVIDAQGRIANITHPMALEECLPQIISGKWDIAAAAKQHLESVLPAKREREFNERVQAILAAEPTDETLVEVDRLTKDFPEQAGTLGLVKFRLLVLADNKSEQALTAGHKLLNGDLGSNPQLLNAMAWMIVSPERQKPAGDELKTFALEVARKSDELTDEKNPAVADTLARALLLNGDSRGAVEVQRRAVSLAKSNPGAAKMLNELQKHLDEYEEAASANKPK